MSFAARVKCVSIQIEMPMEDRITKLKVDDLNRWHKYFQDRKDENEEYLECFKVLEAAKRSRGILKKISTYRKMVEIDLVFKNIDSFYKFVEYWEM